MLRRAFISSFFAFCTFLTGCGYHASGEARVTVRPKEQVTSFQLSDARTAGDKAVERANNATVFAFWLSGVRAQVQPELRQVVPDPAPTTTTSTPPRATVVAVAPESPPVGEITSGGPWICIANAETGGDVTMHGSVYSTAFGMINDIIYQYGTPQQQADIFAGRGSFAEELDIASRFAADHGFGGWGVLTREKCGL